MGTSEFQIFWIRFFNRFETHTPILFWIVGIKVYCYENKVANAWCKFPWLLLSQYFNWNRTLFLLSCKVSTISGTIETISNFVIGRLFAKVFSFFCDESQSASNTSMQTSIKNTKLTLELPERSFWPFLIFNRLYFLLGTCNSTETSWIFLNLG